MPQLNLILTLPQSSLVATSLGVEGLGWHRSPGSAKHFHGRSVFLDIDHKDGKPSFEFLPEGGWRDPKADTEAAIRNIQSGKRTKTALSNHALDCIPLDAIKAVYLVKTSGRSLEMSPPKELMAFNTHNCDENLEPNEIGRRIGRPIPESRPTRCYLVLSPLEFLVMSNLSPIEYAWYATHRPGKVFRAVAFAEVTSIEGRRLVADSVLEAATKEMTGKSKKTKTLASGDIFNKVPFQDWIGFGNQSEGGLYFADRNRIQVSRFPSPVPSSWARADG